jgi:hypothetical protein
MDQDTSERTRGHGPERAAPDRSPGTTAAGSGTSERERLLARIGELQGKRDRALVLIERWQQGALAGVFVTSLVAIAVFWPF